MTSTEAADLTPEPTEINGSTLPQGWRRFWEARKCSPWYLGVTSVLVLLSTASDIHSVVTERRPGESFEGYVVLLVLVSVAFLVQWISTTVAYTVFLPAYLLAETQADTVPVLLFGAVILSAVIATANDRFAIVASLITALWAVLFPLMSGQGTAIIWFTVLITALGISLGAFIRAAWTRREADALKIEEARRQAAEAALRERRVLARDLHDIVAHNLTIISMQARTAQFVGTDEAARQALAVVGGSAKDALVDLRRMLALMREEGVVGDQAQPGQAGSDSSTAVDLGLGVKRVFHELMELGFAVTVDDRMGEHTIPLGTQSALYRVLQEAATNIAKHGDRSAPVEITAAVAGKDAVLRVVNGVEQSTGGRRLRGRKEEVWNSSGVGLNSMQERVSAFGGTFSAGLDEGRWVLEAAVPAGDSVEV